MGLLCFHQNILLLLPNHLCPSCSVLRWWFPMNPYLKIKLRCFPVNWGMLCVWFADILPHFVWLTAQPSFFWLTVNTKHGVTFYGIRHQLNKDSVTGGAAQTNRKIKTKKNNNSVPRKSPGLYSRSQFSTQVTVNCFFKCQVAEFYNKDSQMKRLLHLKGLFI